MIAILSMIFVGLVALEHVYILYLEMFAWTTPRVQRIFGTTPEAVPAETVWARLAKLEDIQLWSEPVVRAMRRRFIAGCGRRAYL